MLGSTPGNVVSYVRQNTANDKQMFNPQLNSSRDFSPHGMYLTKQQQKRWFIAACTNLRFMYDQTTDRYGTLHSHI
jgi:hypothetical protein